MEEETKMLKHFDNVFNTETINNIKFDNLKLLNTLYEYFEESIYTPSQRYSELIHQHIKISEKLIKTFKQDQQNLFKQYQEIGNEMNAEENRQLFIFGYIIARELERETKL